MQRNVHITIFLQRQQWPPPPPKVWIKEDEGVYIKLLVPLTLRTGGLLIYFFTFVLKNDNFKTENLEIHSILQRKIKITLVIWFLFC